jgi:hypothetical protein
MITINFHIYGLDAEQAAAVLPLTTAHPKPFPEPVVEINAGPPATTDETVSIDTDETEQGGARPTAGAAPAISAGPAPSDQTPEGTSLGTPPSAGDSDEGGWINAGPPSLELPTTPQRSQED